ncbi:MAG: beta-ketoacyl-[acyl-carrier-protein] synthase II, partial [Muribaculaceae bacterium]|nr:beta-ketoacyl-[acyl-carrier-protein] synthase II [Muribaculaceae bacterium]
MELKRVVITGLGALTPIGNDVETAWENAKKGVSGAGPITHFDASLFKTKFACEVKDFNAADHFDRKKLRQLDLYAQYALVAADEAIKDAGLEDEGLDKNRIGVIFAAGIGGLHTFEEEAGYYAMNKDNGPKYNPFFIPKMIADIAAGQISID